MDADTETSVEILYDAGGRVTAVEVAQGLEDHLEREDFAAGGGPGAEAGLTGVAVPALHNFMLLVALPCPGYIGAIAEDAALKVSTYEWPGVLGLSGSGCADGRDG